MPKQIRNIALIAHVDAGKTTITENLLFSNGNIRTKGSVDKGTSSTDFLEIEKQKGISVRAAGVSFEKNGVEINLIDTPGHIDFSSETERTLLAIDGAVLIVSALEGVQAHTENLWFLLRKLEIPTLIFINKIDRSGADSEEVLEEISKLLSPDIITLQETENEGNSSANIKSIFNNQSNKLTELTEAVAEKDDSLLEKYLEGENISFEEVKSSLIKGIHSCELFPVLLGVAKSELGMEELCEAIIDYLPQPKTFDTKDVSGIIYKVEHDKTLGKLSHIRLFKGEINKRDIIFNNSQGIEEKVAQTKKVFSKRYEDIQSIKAGEIAIVSGFSQAKAGDVIGKEIIKNQEILVSEVALLTVKVVAENLVDSPKLVEAFRKLTDEDPNLNMIWLNDLRELHISIKGKIQIEILKEILKDRFGISAEFEQPVIIYKETPKKEGEGYVRYWMPKPCWAIMKFSLEPLERGSGVVYESKVGVDDVKQRYQNQVESILPKALKQGIKGWEVTDVKITLIEGEDHVMHTHPPDFAIATPMGIMDGLVNTDTILLEPVLSFRMSFPEEMLGTIASDLTKMRATFANPQFANGKATLTGTVPAATSLDYPIQLASTTAGKGKFSTTFDSYQECPPNEGKTTPFRGISPLDRAKYILHARKAL